jgi:hypothetical protein
MRNRFLESIQAVIQRKKGDFAKGNADSFLV